jgi:hypothetical protein
MLKKYDVREHPAELEVYAYHWLTLTIGKYKYAPLPRSVGMRYVTEYRYTRAKIVDLCIENDFKFFNFLLSSFKLYERRKLIDDASGPMYSYEGKNSEEWYVFNIFILEKHNRGKGLSLEHFAIENIHNFQTIPAHLKALLNQKHP